MPAIDPFQLVIFLVGLAVAMMICFLYPTLGLIAFMSIYLIKPFLLTRMPWLTGAAGFLVDMGTVALAALSLVFYHLKVPPERRKMASYSVFVCLFFAAVWIWLRYPATRFPEYGIKKALIFSIFDVSVVLLGVFWARGLMEASKIIRALFFLGIVVGVGTVFFGRAIAEYEGARISFAYSNPLAPADFSSYLIIISVCYWLSGKTTRRAVVAIALSILGLAAIFRTGTRGPIFVVPPVMLVVFYFYRRTVNLKLVVQIMLVLAVLYGGIMVIRQQGLVGARFQSEEVQEGIMVRVRMMKMTLIGWLENPVLGTGPGDTSVQLESDEELYPHNLVLEVLSEFGLIGFIPFMYLIFKGLSGWRYLASDYFERTELKNLYVPIWACFFMAFISTFKMGGYAGSNMFYFFMGASISLGLLCRQSMEAAIWQQQAGFAWAYESPEDLQPVYKSSDYSD